MFTRVFCVVARVFHICVMYTGMFRVVARVISSPIENI